MLRHDFSVLLQRLAGELRQDRETASAARQALADAGVSPAAARAYVVDIVRAAVGAGHVSARDRDIWLAVTGLTGRLYSRAHVAREYGITASRVDQIRVEVTALVAPFVEHRRLHHPGVQPRDRELREEQAFARLHGQAALARNEREVSTVQALWRERSESTAVRHRAQPGAVPASERAARSRLREPLLARLAQEAQAPLPPLLRLLNSEGRPRRPDSIDPDRLAALVPADPTTPAITPGSGHEVMEAIAGYLCHPVSPDPQTEARAWAAAVRIWMTRRGMAAVIGARHVRRLLGPTHPLTLQVYGDVIGILRGNGYLRTAQHTLANVLRAAEQASLPPAERARLEAIALFGAGAASPQWQQGLEPVPSLLAVQSAQERLLTLTEVGGFPFDWHLNARRRRVMALHQLALHDDGPRRRSSPLWNREVTAEVQALDEIAQSTADMFARINWAMVRTRMSLDLGDTAAFRHYAAQAADMPDFVPGMREILLPDLQGLLRQGKRRRWALPEAAEALVS